MVQPLTEISIKASAFGGQLDIAWTFPEVLPDKYKVYLFRRANEAVSDNDDIARYFQNINNLVRYDYKGLWVFDRISPLVEIIGDQKVYNDKTYYYKAIIRDEDSAEYSEAVSAYGIPHPDIKVNITDGKDVVEQAVSRMFDSVYDVTGKKVVLSKDINIVKQFSIEPIGSNWVMIERVNGSTQNAFWGGILLTNKDKIQKGELDVDIIRCTFMTMDGTDRRDKAAQIFRSMKQQLISSCKASGAYECVISLEGDYYNPQVHGVNALGFIAVFNLVIENKFQIPNPSPVSSVDIQDSPINSDI
jgi:hypothetical protein